MFLKEILIILYCIITVVMSFYFLYMQKINAVGFSIILVAIGVSAILLYNIDQVDKITTKQGDIIEIKKIKADIYAKAEVVKNIGEELASLASIEAFNVAHLCRFAPDNLTELMLDKRDKLITLLNSLGSNKEKISEITKIIDDMVISDLQHKVISKVEEYSYKVLQGGIKINRDEIREKVNESFKDYKIGASKKEIEDYFKSVACYTEEISILLDNYEKFLKTKNI